MHEGLLRAAPVLWQAQEARRLKEIICHQGNRIVALARKIGSPARGCLWRMDGMALRELPCAKYPLAGGQFAQPVSIFRIAHNPIGSWQTTSIRCAEACSCCRAEKTSSVKATNLVLPFQSKPSKGCAVCHDSCSLGDLSCLSLSRLPHGVADSDLGSAGLCGIPCELPFRSLRPIPQMMRGETWRNRTRAAATPLAFVQAGFAVSTRPTRQAILF